MIRRRRSPLRYLVPALLVGGLLWWAHGWLGSREEPLPAGNISTVNDAMETAYGRLSGDFRAKVPAGEFAAMYHRMADPDSEALPEVHQATAYDAGSDDPPRARFRVEYAPNRARAEYHFARVEGIWKLQSFTRVVGDWTAPQALAKAPKPVLPEPAPRPVEPDPKPVEGDTQPGVATPAAGVRLPCHYIIQPGDNLINVSRHFYGTGKHWRRIEEANPGLDPRRMMPGRRILIPSLPDHAPQSVPPATQAEADAE